MTPVSLFVPTALIAIVAVPLALGLVPPNRFYGVRTARTLASREVWFRVNRFGGWAFLAAAAVTTAVYVSAPELASGRSLSGVLALIGPVIAALVAVSVYGRTTDRR